MTQTRKKLLEVKNLKVYYPIRKKTPFSGAASCVKAVDDISFDAVSYTHLSKGLVYNPFDAVMRFWRGRKFIGREEYALSASDLKLAASINPEDWECWYYLGVACYPVSYTHLDVYKRQGVTHADHAGADEHDLAGLWIHGVPSAI